MVVLAALLAVLMMSALAVIYSKNYSRSIFIEIERHERALDQYEVEWGQMQLELSTLAEQNRVEAIAKQRLKLVIPPRESIIYIKP
ncbi:cell division protein FtsL [Methyloglobulus morosus KoM1]|uniref:Cell division protein FtsL n=2 Tax=Methyloglobulus TaxID=1410680 RepID=V5BFC9_9GAMM|nr:cell division protein FtsL [Methyloglobulus morosus KoM1]